MALPQLTPLASSESSRMDVIVTPIGRRHVRVRYSSSFGSYRLADDDLRMLSLGGLVSCVVRRVVSPRGQRVLARS